MTRRTNSNGAFRATAFSQSFTHARRPAGVGRSSRLWTQTNFFGFCPTALDGVAGVAILCVSPVRRQAAAADAEQRVRPCTLPKPNIPS